MPRVLTYTEGNTEAFVKGENVEIRRSHQAVACRKRYAVELGKPRMLLPWITAVRWVIVRWLYALGVSYQAYYSEVGKASHTGKDLTEARSP
jgi:hypothetical protein